MNITNQRSTSPTKLHPVKTSSGFYRDSAGDSAGFAPPTGGWLLMQHVADRDEATEDHTQLGRESQQLALLQNRK